MSSSSRNNGPRTVAKWRKARPWLRETQQGLPSTSQLKRRGGSLQTRLLGWYAFHGRSFPWREPQITSYERVVSEVLLQQTTALAVANSYPKIFSRFPDWKTLASASESDIGNSLRPLGLWRCRARTLTKLAQTMLTMSGAFPRDRQELERLPGIGQYTASAILLFCHGLPEPLLDVNMARVLERYFGFRTKADLREDEFLQAAARAAVSGHSPIEANWAFLDLGALVCKSRQPMCRKCPLRNGCFYRRTHENTTAL
jgi:A/G-specific adenine glycosylase